MAPSHFACVSRTASASCSHIVRNSACSVGYLHNCYTLQHFGVAGINMYLDGGNTEMMLTSCFLNMKT